MNTDLQWELFAQTDPYQAIAGGPEFAIENFEEAKEEFFATGNRHIDDVIAQIEAHLGMDYGTKDRSALDFGCGAGRLLVPLCRRFDHACGIDVSPSMLELCTRHLEEEGLTNFTLAPTPEAAGDQTFDLVHSYITLQHIPEERGISLLEQLLSRLSPGGVAAIHLTYHEKPLRRSPLGRLRDIARDIRLLAIKSLPRKESSDRTKLIPPMMMENYSLNRVFLCFFRAELEVFHVAPTNHAHCPGAFIFAQAKR